MKSDPIAEFIIGGAFIVVVAIAFAIDRIWGWHAIGLAEVAWGAWVVVTRRLSFGIEAQPPVGHITGSFAVAVGILAIALGALFIWTAQVIDTFTRGLS